MMADYSPRLIPHPAAQRWADYNLILEDLSHVDECCTRRDSISLGNTDMTVLRALATSALIAYRRCFGGSGQRVHITSRDLDRLSNEQLARHQKVWKYASQAYAHPISEVQNGAVGIMIGVCSDGSLKLGGFWGGGVSQFDLSVEHRRDLRELTETVREKIIRPTIEEIKTELTSWLAQYSVYDIDNWKDALTTTLPKRAIAGRTKHNEAGSSR